MELLVVIFLRSAPHRQSEDAVVSTQDVNGEQRLVAYLTSRDAAPRVSDLRAHLGKSLPEYMVPSAFLILDVVPLGANGKVDRHALPKPDFNRPTLDTPYRAPRNASEAALAGIWEETLQIQQVGIDDHFQDLGADSLTATLFAAKILDRFGLEVPLLSLFERPTIAELMDEIGEHLAGDGHASFAAPESR